MRHFLPFSKVEENGDGTLTVTGVASSEAVDSAGEIIRADAMRVALPDFFRHGSGALREMHQLSAAGTVDVADVDGMDKTYITTTVVDPVAIKKVLTKTYKGFSIGGRVTERDSANRKVITGIQLAEISLVDRPCNPDAVFDMWKADGIDLDDDLPMEVEPEAEVEQTDDKAAADGGETIDNEFEQDPDFVTALESPDGVEKRKFDAKERKKDSKSGDAEADGSFPIENKQDLRNAIRAYGRSKNKAKTKAHIMARARALGAEDLIPDAWKDTKKVTEKPADPGEQLAKAGETAKTISPTQVGDVMNDGAGNGDSATPGVPIAGARVMANFPGGSDAGAVNVENPATAGNDGQDKLSTKDTPIIEHTAPETPTSGSDTRTHVHPEGSKAEVADPISSARDAADKALKTATASVEKATRAAGVSSLPAPLREGAALRKGLGTVSRLGCLLSELAYMLADVRSEAEWEADDSPVPEQLRAAIAPLAAVYRAMSDEELSELMAIVDTKTAAAMAVAVAGGDVIKAFSAVAGEDMLTKLAPAGEALSKAEGRIAVLEGERSELLKVTSSLTDGLEALGKRVEELADMPMPPKTLTAAVPLETVVKAVTKEDDTTGLAKVAASNEAKISMTADDFQKAWDAMPADQRAELALRASLGRPIPINR